jgi:hypothetical protein
MRRYLWFGVVTLVCAAGIWLNVTAGDNRERLVFRVPFGQSKPTTGGGTQILYYGGPVLTGPVSLYVIYYGGASAFPVNSQTVINAFLGGLGGQPQYNVNTTYCEANTASCTGSGTSVSGLLSAGQVFQDTGSQGTNISYSAVPKIIQNALTAPGGLPVSSSAIYIVVTAPTVKVSGFCGSYCAFHTQSATIVSGKTIHYALAPEPDSQCTTCGGNLVIFGEAVTPTGDPGADEVVDSLMHEISETVTDPDLNAWYTSKGEENGDLCNWTYGTNLPKASNGASYNASWNGYSYLIQLIWKNGPLPQACAAAP